MVGSGLQSLLRLSPCESKPRASLVTLCPATSPMNSTLPVLDPPTHGPVVLSHTPFLCWSLHPVLSAVPTWMSLSWPPNPIPIFRSL